MSTIDEPVLKSEVPRPIGEPGRVAALIRVGDALSAIETGLVDMSAGERGCFATLAREFGSLKVEATGVRAWDLAEVALACERLFSSAAFCNRDLRDHEYAFFDNVRRTLAGIAANPDQPEQLDMDVIGDALDRILDELGVD